MIVSNNPGCDAPVIGNRISYHKGGKWPSLLFSGWSILSTLNSVVKWPEVWMKFGYFGYLVNNHTTISLKQIT